MILVAIAIALAIAGIAMAAFVVIVIGIQATDRRKRLRDTYPGVYVRQKPKRARDDDEFVKWMRGRR